MASQAAYERAQLAREYAWDGKFPVDPKAIAAGIFMTKHSAGEKISVPIRMEGRLLDGFSGYAKYMDGDSPYFLCVYNTDEADTRQRFTQAHELGHVMLNHVAKDKSPRRDTTFKAQAGDWIEIDANAFAAELIMPEKYVRHLASKITDIAKLAKEFGVSPWAMHYRLMNLGLL
jgi:Zn-dependent peptidase ImmA (M78 family)